MRLTVRLFAAYRELVGANLVEVVLSDRATARDVPLALAESFPQLREALASGRLVVNQEFASPDLLIRPGDEVAMLPPVSGG